MSIPYVHGLKVKAPFADQKKASERNPYNFEELWRNSHLLELMFASGGSDVPKAEINCIDLMPVRLTTI